MKTCLRDRSYCLLAVAVHILSFNQGTTPHHHRTYLMRPLRFCRTRELTKQENIFKWSIYWNEISKPVYEIGVTVAGLWPCIFCRSIVATTPTKVLVVCLAVATGLSPKRLIEKIKGKFKLSVCCQQLKTKNVFSHAALKNDCKRNENWIAKSSKCRWPITIGLCGRWGIL